MEIHWKMIFFCCCVMLSLKESSATDCMQDILADYQHTVNGTVHPCTWNIKGTTGTTFELVIREFTQERGRASSCVNSYLQVSFSVSPKMVRSFGKFPRYIYISDESFQLTLVCENGDATFKLYVDIIPVEKHYTCQFNKNMNCTKELHLSFRKTVQQNCSGEESRNSQEPTDGDKKGFVLLNSTTPIRYRLPAGGYIFRITAASFCNNSVLSASSNCSQHPINQNLTIKSVTTHVLEQVCDTPFMMVFGTIETDPPFIAIDRIVIRRYVENAVSSTQKTATNKPIQMTTAVRYHQSGNLEIYVIISGILTFILGILGLIVAVYLRKRKTHVVNDDGDVDKGTTNQQENSIQNPPDQELSCSEVVDSATSEPLYHILSYSQSDHSINTEDGHRICNLSYQSLEFSKGFDNAF